MNSFPYKIILVLILLGNSLKAQNTTPNNTIFKLNFYSLLVNDAVDLSYEQHLTKAQSLGIAGYILHQNRYDMMINFYKSYSITPYYRYYFEEDRSHHSYVELFTMFLERNKNITTNTSNEDLYEATLSVKNKGIAPGLALGYTITTKHGLILDFSAGIGRNYAKYPETVPFIGRGGIGIGKQF